jgi:hypothetical protein
MNFEEFFRHESASCLQQCAGALVDGSQSLDSIINKLESFLLALELHGIESLFEVKTLTENALFLLESKLNGRVNRKGRPTIEVDMTAVETMLSMKFRATTIAKMFGISIRSLHRKMKAAEISVMYLGTRKKIETVSLSLNVHFIFQVRHTYTQISREELGRAVSSILNEFPNTGSKRMMGYLLSSNINVTQYRVREVLREVDPLGVLQRTSQNRAIYRRQYYVPYSNTMWHIDTNMKLVRLVKMGFSPQGPFSEFLFFFVFCTLRWKIIVRGGVDGKSRTCVYLEAGNDNRATSNLNSFMKGVEIYGIPFRVRSDKGPILIILCNKFNAAQPLMIYIRFF